MFRSNPHPHPHTQTKVGVGSCWDCSLSPLRSCVYLFRVECRTLEKFQSLRTILPRLPHGPKTFTKRLYCKCWKKDKKIKHGMWRISWGNLTWAQHWTFLFLRNHDLWKFDVHSSFKKSESQGQHITHEPWDKNVYFLLVWQKKKKKNTIYQQVLWVFVMCRLTVGLPLLAQHLDVHRWVNAIKNFSPFLSGVFVASVDGSGLPVGPVERLVIKSKGEWVGERTLHDGLSASVNRYM